MAEVHEKSAPPTPRPVIGSKYSDSPAASISARVSARMRPAIAALPALAKPSAIIQLTTAQIGPRQYRTGSKAGSDGSVDGTRCCTRSAQALRVFDIAPAWSADAARP